MNSMNLRGLSGWLIGSGVLLCGVALAKTAAAQQSETCARADSLAKKGDYLRAELFRRKCAREKAVRPTAAPTHRYFVIGSHGSVPVGSRVADTSSTWPPASAAADTSSTRPSASTDPNSRGYAANAANATLDEEIAAVTPSPAAVHKGRRRDARFAPCIAALRCFSSLQH